MGPVSRSTSTFPATTLHGVLTRQQSTYVSSPSIDSLRRGTPHQRRVAKMSTHPAWQARLLKGSSWSVPCVRCVHGKGLDGDMARHHEHACSDRVGAGESSSDPDEP